MGKAEDVTIIISPDIAKDLKKTTVELSAHLDLIDKYDEAAELLSEIEKAAANLENAWICSPDPKALWAHRELHPALTPVREALAKIKEFKAKGE